MLKEDDLLLNRIVSVTCAQTVRDAVQTQNVAVLGHHRMRFYRIAPIGD